MTNERPIILQMKRRHFNTSGRVNNIKDDLEWMRINAERERIARFKFVAKDQASLYYSIVKKITEELNQGAEKKN
eukprot:CAMPEP_0116884854 /NCGR_PEP_ID=MMETSP0463-20121206/17927_1 /TAXON_ID=181622 /ORGANISM="Strombidinopsis sp, Strain SopsisLIS2011" /LENGTH=74 /DNA_ID=CAMNT_0004542137 /DNA_START=662 /DNA_END=886 /DNA_ORIENTATION=-